MPEVFGKIRSARFTIEQGTRLLIQVPQQAAARLLQAILAQEPLHWGDYDQVAYTSSTGVQQFRTLPQARNRATAQAVTVDCVELQIFVPKQGQDLEPLLCAIYYAHPYEEPVIQLIPAARSLHGRGQDEANPNRFWNQEAADWVPDIHR